RSEHIQGVRSAEFLNWRYRNHPSQKFLVTVARRHEELVAYAVLSLQEGSGAVCDLNAVDEESTLPALLSYMEHVLLKKEADTISAPMQESSRFRKYFRSAVFYPRERCPMLIHDSATSQHKWFIQPADRDS